MFKEILMLVDIEIEKKKKIYHHKNPIFSKDPYIEKVLVSKKIYSGEKKLEIFYWLLV